MATKNERNFTSTFEVNLSPKEVLWVLQHNGKIRIRFCLNCFDPFHAQDGRKRYCTVRCQGTARQRHHREEEGTVE